jgi:hypothetical protein
MALTTNAPARLVPLSFLANLCHRWPITTVSIGLVITVWIYDHLSASGAPGSETLRPNVAAQYPPRTPLKPLPGTRTTTSRARDSKAALTAFKRVLVGENEVDYVADDVTIRLFTPRHTPAQVPHSVRQLDIGEDVTVRYFAYKPDLTPRPQIRSESAAAQPVERSLPTSK